MLHVSNIRYRWHQQGPLILDIPDFKVGKGERVFLKGPSGSGKTTLLNLLGGVAVPESGRISIMDSDISAFGGARRDAFRADHIGFIFQMFNLLPYLSLIDNVTLPCHFSKVRRQRALQRSSSIEEEARRILFHMKLDIDELSARSVSRLSMGQQQRVAAARSLIGSPELVIADEPTSSLDAGVRTSFLNLLFQEIRDSSSSLLFVSHDASLEDAFDRTVPLTEINRIIPQE